jgi:hypothetical protein
MTKGKKEKLSMKPAARVVHLSTSRQSKGNDSSESDDSLFEDDVGRDDHDDDSVFDEKKDREGDEDRAPKDSEGGGTTKDTKDGGEQCGRTARILTMDEIRK